MKIYYKKLLIIIFISFFALCCTSGVFAQSVNDLNTTASPTVKITSPHLGAILNGTGTIIAEVTGGITGLSFYLDKVNSTDEADKNIFLGLGIARVANKQVWEKLWDTTLIPEGQYFLFAQIEDTFGHFHTSSKMLIAVDQPGNININQAVTNQNSNSEINANLIINNTNENENINSVSETITIAGLDDNSQGKNLINISTMAWVFIAVTGLLIIVLIISVFRKKPPRQVVFKK